MKEKLKFNTPFYLGFVSVLYFIVACTMVIIVRDDTLRDNLVTYCQTVYVLLLVLGLVVRDFILKFINRNRV